jgi:hypothetical protein
MIVTKHDATVGGQAAVLLTFTVQLPDGTLATAQTVTTMKLLRTQMQVFQTLYDDEGFPIKQ